MGNTQVKSKTKAEMKAETKVAVESQEVHTGEVKKATSVDATGQKRGGEERNKPGIAIEENTKVRLADVGELNVPDSQATVWDRPLNRSSPGGASVICDAAVEEENEVSLIECATSSSTIATAAQEENTKQQHIAVNGESTAGVQNGVQLMQVSQQCHKQMERLGLSMGRKDPSPDPSPEPPSIERHALKGKGGKLPGRGAVVVAKKPSCKKRN